MKKGFQSILAFVLLAFSFGCTFKKAELGTEGNPIKLHFIPSVDSRVLEDSSKITKEFLEKKTNYKIEVTIPQSFIAVVEAFGTKKADVAVLNTHGYYLAHKKYGAEAKLMVLRNGASTYQSQFLAHVDSKINSLADLAGKKIAYVDPASASGYLLPMKTLKDRHISPKETVFAMKHDSVVTMIYQKQVEAGATFYTPPIKNEKGIETLQDARRLVLTQFPDVEKKVKIVELSDSIPNDPIIFRKEMSAEMKDKLATAFLEFLNTTEGKEAFYKIYSVNGLKPASDADYDEVRKMFDLMESEKDNNNTKPK